MLNQKFKAIYTDSVVSVNQNLSKELQTGKAAEHLVCADLLLQGHNAFLADQGLPYDVLVDMDGQIKKVQVKSTLKPFVYQTQQGVYRFGLRTAKRGKRRIETLQVDYFAFVALDLRVIAYIPSEWCIGPNGVITLIEFKTNTIDYQTRTYSNGKERTSYGRCIQDYSSFPPTEEMKQAWRYNRWNIEKALNGTPN